jgi:hypothetical protein
MLIQLLYIVYIALIGSIQRDGLEEVMEYFQVLPTHMPGEAEENYETPRG